MQNPKNRKNCVDKNTEDNKFVFEKLCLKNNNNKIALDRTIDDILILQGQTKYLC